ncbi:ClpX C4-type zinc finger protein [Actinomadura madurae]
MSEVSCSFCGAEPGQVKKIIAGPNSYYICDECVGLSSPAAANGTASSSRTTLLRDSTTEEYGQLKDLAEQLSKLLAKAEQDAEECRFCRKKFRMLLRPASAPATTICLECIDLCLEIIEEEAAEERDTGPSSG